MILYKIDESNYTDAEIMALAKHKGYQEKVIQEQDVLDADGVKTGTEMVEVDNPELPIDYIGRVFKQMADSWISDRLIREKRIQLREQEKTDIENIKASISATTAITKE